MSSETAACTHMVASQSRALSGCEALNKGPVAGTSQQTARGLLDQKKHYRTKGDGHRHPFGVRRPLPCTTHGSTSRFVTEGARGLDDDKITIVMRAYRTDTSSRCSAAAGALMARDRHSKASAMRVPMSRKYCLASGEQRLRSPPTSSMDSVHHIVRIGVKVPLLHVRLCDECNHVTSLAVL